MKKEREQIKIKLKTAIILIILLILLATTICFVVYNINKPARGEKLPQQKVQEADIDFAMKFLKLENNKQNMIYSPLSIKYALAMLKEGANGNTKTQIENVAGNLNLTKYNNINKVLSLANAVYIRDDYSKYVKKDYKNILTEKYDAEIKYDSFKNAKKVNNWIEDKTLGIIKNMLPDTIVQNPDNKMLLINALAIDMEWEEQFDSEDTHGRDFYLEDGSTMIATTMNMETSSESLSYYKNKDVTVLKMDYKEYNGTQLEFIAIMPEKNLSNYIENFDIDQLNNITKKSKLASETKKGVNISIPRFEFDYNLKLKDDLIKLGITDAFDENVADFSNVSEKELYVSDALHKADIEFAEKGTKAAAATVIIMQDLAMMEEDEYIELNFDKPFLYLIRDKNTEEIWFAGTVYEPNAWENDKGDY